MHFKCLTHFHLLALSACIGACSDQNSVRLLRPEVPASANQVSTAIDQPPQPKPHLELNAQEYSSNDPVYVFYDWAPEGESTQLQLVSGDTVEGNPAGTEGRSSGLQAFRAPVVQENEIIDFEVQLIDTSNSQVLARTSARTIPAKGEDSDDCTDFADGATENRTRYLTPRATTSRQCEAETQIRRCENGTFAPWQPNRFAFTECRVDVPFETCSDEAAKEIRERFRSKSVPFGSTCERESQERTCVRNRFTPWSGTFQAESCQIREPLACAGGVTHGDAQARTRFAQAEVGFGQSCQNETQQRTCDNGRFLNWSGTFTHERCEVTDPLPCGNIDHGDKENRTRYQAPEAPLGATCQTENQERTCSNGQFSDWSGTYASATCAPESTVTCSTASTGETCDAAGMPIIGQLEQPVAAPSMACGPTAAVMTFGTYMAKGLTIGALAGKTIGNQVSYMADLMEMNAESGTWSTKVLPALSAVVATALPAILTSSQSNWSWWEQSTILERVRIQRLPIILYGYYTRSVGTIISGRTTYTYTRNGGHYVSIRGFNAREEAALRIIYNDPWTKTKQTQSVKELVTDAQNFHNGCTSQHYLVGDDTAPACIDQFFWISP